MERIPWHLAMGSALKNELKDYSDQLIFQTEMQPDKEPAELDLLVIKKNGDADFNVDIAKIFRKYNIIDYKSTDDEISIDDFAKVLSYAYWYKSNGSRVNERPCSDITISLIRESYPESLILSLKNVRHTVENATPGIYYIRGYDFKCQIIVARELPDRYNSMLILSNSEKPADLQQFLSEMQFLR